MKKSLFHNPKIRLLVIAVIGFIILARVFFMSDAVKETKKNNPQRSNSVFVFFKQDVTTDEMPDILNELGVQNCAVVGGGTHVYDCPTDNPDEVIKKAATHEKIFDALLKEQVY